MITDGIIVAGKYRLLEFIAEGTFGEVFYGNNSSLWIALELETNRELAVKLELKSNKCSFLKVEAAIYGIMSGEVGFPKLYWE